MSEVSESKDMQLEKSSEIRTPSIPETDRPKFPEAKDGKDINNTPFQPDTDIYNDIFKKNGLISENSESQANESQSDSVENDKDYSEYLEKGDDGKYYDKETGKAYDSVEQWVKEQETLAKRYEGTAKYYEDKAKKEWARFKNADQNGETDAEKWEHYRKSQEYYAKAKECKEKAARIREKLGQSTDNSDEETDLDDKGKDDYGKPYRNKRGEFLPNNTFSLMGFEYETDENGNICKADGKDIPDEHKDDNGKTYRNPDGGYIPNNTFVLDGHTYETDDSGNICKIDGKEVPENCKDDVGNVYRTPDGGLIPNNRYILDGILYETDNNGEICKVDGKVFSKELSALADVTDFDSLERYFQNLYNIRFDNSVKELDFKTVKETMIGIEAVIGNFPDVGEFLKNAITTDFGVMYCNSDELAFNPSYFSEDQVLVRVCQDCSSAGVWIPNSSPSSIGVHEAAHGVEWALIQANSSYKSDSEKIQAWNDCKEATAIVIEACNNIKDTPYAQNKTQTELIMAISSYALKDDSETMAEAFADVFANGTNANPLSLEITRLAKVQMDRYKGGLTC